MFTPWRMQSRHRIWQVLPCVTCVIVYLLCRERQVATGSEDGASRGSHSSQLPQRLHGTGSSRLRRPAVPLQRNPDFPNLPSTVPLTYTLTMQACLSERRSERPTFAQITTILHDLCSEVARGNYINSLGLIQVCNSSYMHDLTRPGAIYVNRNV